MRRALVLILAVACMSALGITLAGAVGVPEIDRANATFGLAPVGTFTSTSCLGEDGIGYTTFRGKWKDPESESTPGFTDYNLSGSLSVTKVVWTINLTTQRGVLTATATLTDSTSGARVYSGKLTLITQGLPGPPPVSIPGRGWLSASTYTGGVLDGGSLLANVEVNLFNPNPSGNGRFGDFLPASNPDFSVTAVNQTC